MNAHQVQNIEESKNGPIETKYFGGKSCAALRQDRLEEILHILELADKLTSSPVSEYGEMVGGYVFGMVWNDVSGGHEALGAKGMALSHLPSNIGPTIMALAARDSGHPHVLPRFECTFSPPASGLCPNDNEYRVEGDADTGEIRGKPPRIATDASGVPNVRVPIPPLVESAFRALDISRTGGQREALYHLVRVCFGDRAFLALNEGSVSSRLKVGSPRMFVCPLRRVSSLVVCCCLLRLTRWVMNFVKGALCNEHHLRNVPFANNCHPRIDSD